MGPTKRPESERISFFLRAEQIAALRAVQKETGVPVSVLIRRGVDLVLEERGKAPARRGGR